MLEKVLIEYGYVVDSYKNPLLALEKFKAHSYNLVILDIKMPELNGFALYREIKRLDKKVKICFLTAGEMYYDAHSDVHNILIAEMARKKYNDSKIGVWCVSKLINFNIYPDIPNVMTSETEHEGNVPNPFLNPIRAWQNYLVYWMEVNRNFYENAVRTNEQWLKAFWDPWFKAGNPERKETAKVE